MRQAVEKQITIQFHFHDKAMSSKQGNGSGLLFAKHDKDLNNTKIQRLESFAKRNAYEYNIFQHKNEFHLNIPENCLRKHIIQNKKAQLQTYESSDKVLSKETLTLINFTGEVVFNTIHNSASASIIRGFIKIAQDIRTFNYTIKQVEKQAYQAAKQQFDLYSQAIQLNSNHCLGIIHIKQAKDSNKDSKHNQADINLTSEIQFIHAVAPDTQVLCYTGISILSALKTAITDQINKPKLLILNYNCPAFEMSETEFREIRYWVDIAKSRNILIISSITNVSTSEIENTSLINQLCGNAKAFVQVNDMFDSPEIPINYQTKNYLIPLKQMNPILWALRLLKLSSDINQTIEMSLKLTRRFFNQRLKQKQFNELILPYIIPGSDNEDEYFLWMSNHVRNEAIAYE